MPETSTPPENLTTFEQHRDRLRGLAYRLTGSVAETDDILQDAYLRWTRASNAVASPGAYLTKLVTHLCLDHMKSARTRRESYVGTWLPEPIFDTSSMMLDNPTELAHDVTFALLLALERLTPLERAAFILHDVFEVEYTDIAEALGRSETSCRQLAARGRNHVRKQEARAPLPEQDEKQRLVTTFFDAVRTGQVEELAALLTEAAVFHSDGGGQVKAATKAVRGGDRVARFLIGVASKFPQTYAARLIPLQVNGMPGAALWRDETLERTFAFEFQGPRVAAIYAVANPQKLAHLRSASSSD